VPQVIAINQDITPQGRPLNSSDITQWARHLSDGSVAFAIYNPFDTPLRPQPLLFSALGWPHGTTAAVRDLWMHETLGTYTDMYDTCLLLILGCCLQLRCAGSHAKTRWPLMPRACLGSDLRPSLDHKQITQRIQFSGLKSVHFLCALPPSTCAARPQ
jgi:hypothetical protein